MKIFIFLLLCTFILPKSVVASENPIREHIEKYKDLSKKDQLVLRGLNQAAQTQNLGRVYELLRSQVVIRMDEITNRIDMIESLCKKRQKESVCLEKSGKLRAIGNELQTSLTDMRLTIAGRSLQDSESIAVMMVGTQLQKAYMNALLNLLKYTIVQEAQKIPKGNQNPKELFLGLEDLSELADIQMLPPPPGSGDLLLGK